MFPIRCETSPVRAPPLVLVVDDERLMRWALRAHLEAAGFAVLEAADAGQALQAMASNELTALVLDYRLPDMDGFEVLRRAGLTSPACRVVMMTAHAAPEHEAAARSLGASHYLAKPFDTVALLAALAS